MTDDPRPLVAAPAPPRPWGRHALPSGEDRTRRSGARAVRDRAAGPGPDADAAVRTHYQEQPMNTPGQSTVAATLDAIDAATEQRCACGCGARLTNDGPSAWFATEACQRRWNGGRVCEPDTEAVITVGIPRSYEAFQQALIEAIAAAYRIGSVQVGTPDSDGPPYTHTVSGGGVPSFTITDEDVVDAANRELSRRWPAGPQRVRIHAGDGVEEIGTLTPDPDGDVVMASGRYAFQPANLCPEHARQAQPPADPMLAAIEAKRHRNTGPRPRQRAPRRIDPRRSR